MHSMHTLHDAGWLQARRGVQVLSFGTRRGLGLGIPGGFDHAVPESLACVLARLAGRSARETSSVQSNPEPVQAALSADERPLQR